MQTLLAQMQAAAAAGPKGVAPPIDVQLKSVLVVDGSEMAQVIQKYQADSGQRGLGPQPLPQ